MTASYPDNIYQPRTVENKDGVVYNANEAKRLFAEDINKANEEIVAIQNALGPNLENVEGGSQAMLAVTVTAIQNDPPASPSVGDQYIVGEGTGSWLGQDDKIATYAEAGWSFTTPTFGMVALVGLVRYLYYGYWLRSSRSVPISLDSLRKNGSPLTALTQPAVVTFSNLIYYIAWPKSNIDIVCTDGIIIPIDISLGTAPRVRVSCRKGGATNEYIEVSLSITTPNNGSAILVDFVEQLIPNTGDQFLTFTADRNLDKLEAGGYFYLTIRHGPSSVKSNAINVLSLSLEYDNLY